MTLQFNLAEILRLAEEGLAVMRAENPDMSEMLAVTDHIAAIVDALAFSDPKCLADYTVSLDIMDTFEP